MHPGGETLADNRDVAVYNIKAVARLTGVAADTLRRWESRYNILSPQRSTGGYRMYSQRDVDTIRWLKARVEEGLTISRACDLLRTRQDTGLADGGGAPGAVGAAPMVATQPTGVRALPVLADEMLTWLEAMDETHAGQVMTEALSLYTVEQVVEDLVYPLLVEVGERWMRGDWSVAQEHFASAFMRGRLANLLHASPHNAGGRLALVACAPEELHEIGALVIALYLRRNGYRVIYLGQNVPLDSLVSMVRTLRPAVLCCSAARPDTAANLRPLAGQLVELHRQTGYRPVLVYGGLIFNRQPRLAEEMGGVYSGPAAGAAVARVRELTA
jgi:DNA-binding transcriptional MerR regulator/methylmalonyl-CoA mutase cobalamin-binding subunit